MTDGTYRELVGRWKALGAAGDVVVREVACVNAPRTLLCAEFGDPHRPAVAIAAGTHGDEPAGAWALLEMVEDGAWHPAFSYRLWPCVNPTGFSSGTRESADGLDLNRTFGRGGTSPEARAMLVSNRNRHFALSLDLHEDCDAVGFYCYEYGGGDIGGAVVAALDEAGLPVDPLCETFTTAGPLDDARCRRKRGRIVPDGAAEAAVLGGLSYSLRMVRGTAVRALTFESPGRAGWPVRLAMHRTAMAAALRVAAE